MRCRGQRPDDAPGAPGLCDPAAPGRPPPPPPAAEGVSNPASLAPTSRFADLLAPPSWKGGRGSAGSRRQRPWMGSWWGGQTTGTFWKGGSRGTGTGTREGDGSTPRLSPNLMTQHDLGRPVPASALLPRAGLPDPESADNPSPLFRTPKFPSPFGVTPSPAPIHPHLSQDTGAFFFFF